MASFTPRAFITTGPLTNPEIDRFAAEVNDRTSDASPMGFSGFFMDRLVATLRAFQAELAKRP